MQAEAWVEAPSSEYQGVTWGMLQKQWLVSVRHGRRSIQFGWYRDEEEAACAHDAAAVVIGPQAQLNFPKQVGFASAKFGSVSASVFAHDILSLHLSSPIVCLASCLCACVCTLSWVTQ